MSNGTDVFCLDGTVWNGNVTVQARSQDLCRGGSNKRAQKFLVATPTLINHTHKIANKTAAMRLEQGGQQELHAEYEMSTA